MNDMSPAKLKRGLKPLSADAFQQAVRWECEQAADWISSNISTLRMKSEAYYEGLTTQKSEPGRSKLIVTVVRDAIHSILPNIGRVFTQTDEVGEFSSDDEEDEGICKEMTLFCNGVFNKYGGYKALIWGTTDALKSRIGVVKVSLQRKEVASYSVSGELDEEQLSDLMEEVQSGETMITEMSEPFDTSEPSGDSELDAILPDMRRKVVMSKKSYRNKWLLSTVAPESVIIDADATCIGDARIVGTRENMAIYAAMEMGIPYELLQGNTTDDGSMLQTERFNRLGYDPQDYTDNWSNDPTAQQVLITEAWMRIDADGDGVIELRHLICVGVNYEIVVDEVVHCVPLAVFMTDLQPHVFFPISLAEDLIQDQDAQTSVTRSILDNIALVNSPRTEINENFVNLEDAKNTEIGAMIRVKQMGQINELTTPFVAGQTLPVLEYLHQTAESRSGVTKLSQGIDPNALQATSRIAANAAVQGGDARIEMMARNIAETGVKEMFQAILRVAMYELKGEQSVKTPTGYKKVNPSRWHDQVSISINVGLGNGRIEEKQQVLQGVVQQQMGVIEKLGMTNPYATWDNVRNSWKSLLRLNGIKDVGTYFPIVPPEVGTAFEQKQAQQAAQAAQAQAPPGPDVVGAAKVKAEADIHINTEKIQAQAAADVQRIQAETMKVIAEMKQAHTLEMTAIRAEIETKMAIAVMNYDAKQDATAAKFAVDSKKVVLDEQETAIAEKQMDEPRELPA